MDYPCNGWGGASHAFMDMMAYAHMISAMLMDQMRTGMMGRGCHYHTRPVYPPGAGAHMPVPPPPVAPPEVPSAGSGNGRLGAQVPSKVRRWEPYIQSAAQKYNLDPNLIAAVIMQESGGNPNAQSGVGAAGLMQLMPSTARGLGLSEAERFDPAKNIDAGSRYLRKQLDRFNGDVSLALAAYNAGPGAVRKHGGIPPFRETQRYVPSILDKYQQYRGSY